MATSSLARAERVPTAEPWGDSLNQSFFRDLAETSPDGIWVFDLDGHTIYANAAIADLYGADVSELRTLRVLDTLDDEGREQFRAHLAAVRQGHFNPTDVECQWVRRDGTKLWVLVRESALHAADGTLIGVLHRISDYSHRHATLDELKKAQTELAGEMVQNGFLQAIATGANDANSLLEILVRGRDLLLLLEDWERAVAFLVGSDGLTRVYPVGEVSDAEREDDDHHPERAARELAVAERAFQTGTKTWDDSLTSLAFPITHKGRVYAVGVVTATPPVVRFELIETMADQIVLQLENVLARERAEQSLAEARDAATAASLLKSAFLATVSHEIRTPLNGVLGLNDLLLRTPLDEHQTRLAEGIQHSGQLLMALISDVLDFSKIEAGRLVLEHVNYDVRSVLDKVAEPIGKTATTKGIEFSSAYAQSVPKHVRGDPIRISQVYANLLTNAVKFTDAGHVSVVVGAETVGASVLLRVQITDTGIGIGKDAADVFAPFQQADSSTTRVYGGSGLGLAISRELAHAMGGDIGFTSRAGEGSVFWFTAMVDPLADQSDVAPAIVRAPPTLTTCHVLVVEDNEVNQLVAVGMLKALGHTADVAADGIVALDMLERAAYDVVLMDVQMPRLDGYATTARIRSAESSGQRVPIVAMTASAVAGERARCLEAGMDDYLPKPVTMDGIARALARVFGDQARKVSPPIPRSSPKQETVDLSRLDMLRAMDPESATYLKRAIGRFADSAGALLAAIRAATTTDDLRFHAHKLGGGASNLGLVRVAAIALDLEVLAASGTRHGAVPIIDDLAKALDDGFAALADYRRVLPPDTTP